jgi:predicted nucleic acid-binding protein
LILVDSSVWIDYLTGVASAEAEMLHNLMSEPNRVRICGIILQEVLQGIRDEREFRRIKAMLSRFPFADLNRETFIHAANIYRRLRRKGISISTGDAAIAAVAVQSNLALLTRDTHFTAIAGEIPLKLALSEQPEA